MALIMCLVALAIGFIYYIVRRRLTYWERRGVLHDKPSIPKGNIGDWPKKRHLTWIFKDSYLKFKNSGFPFAGFYFFLRKAVILLDTDLIKKVLIKDFNNFENRGFFYNEVDDPLSAHLLSLEGQKWRNLRHKLTPTFTSGKMKIMFPVVQHLGQELANMVDMKLEGKPQLIEVTDLMGRFTADVIGTCAFGLNCNSLHDPEAQFVKMGKRAITERRYGGLLDFFIFGFPKLARLLHLKFNVQDVHDFYFGIVRDTVNYRLKNKLKRNDFMDMLLEMYENHEEGNETDGLSFEEIAAQAFAFFVAGFETSSTSMGFAVYELAQNHDIQDKLRAEVKHVLAKNNGDFNYETLKQIIYLEKVINETLRKYPVAGHLVRIANVNYPVGDGKFTIEKGTKVIMSVLGIHHNPEYYPNPMKFDPERFTDEKNKARPLCTFLPFGDGPRNCIGMRFAFMQMSVGLSYLIKDYKFSIAPETQDPLKLSKKGFLLSSENGIYLRVERI